MHFKILRFAVILASLGFSVEAELLNSEYVMVENPGCISYYGMDRAVRSAAFCRFLCDREEGCIGVGIENRHREVNCYFQSLTISGYKALSPPSQIQHWIKGKIKFAQMNQKAFQ